MDRALDVEETPSAGGFIFRDAAPEDRDEVLVFTANTWDAGDYIDRVYDYWLADKQGRFLVAVDAGTGGIAGIDKLSFLAPGEGWFEGIRVNPEYRGRGLASEMQSYLIEAARSLGARTIRFITNGIPGPIHTIAYRDGFVQRFLVRNWMWRPEESDRSPWPEDIAPLKLRDAAPSEAGALYEWWTRSASYYATEGLADKHWSFGSSSPAEWEAAASRRCLFVSEETRVEDISLPPPTVLVLPRHDDQGRPEWHLSVISADGADWEGLAAGLIDRAREAGVAMLQGLFPDMAQVHEAVQRTGYHADHQYGRFVLFELTLDPKG